jgi:hypothetical protein
MFLFSVHDGTNRREFEIRAPFDQTGRGLVEGLKLKEGWPAEVRSVTLKLILGTTTVTKTWAGREAVQSEYLLDFCLDLKRRYLDTGAILFEAELEVDCG